MRIIRVKVEEKLVRDSAVGRETSAKTERRKQLVGVVIGVVVAGVVDVGVVFSVVVVGVVVVGVVVGSPFLSETTFGGYQGRNF